MTKLVAGGAGLSLLNFDGVETVGATRTTTQGQTPAATVPQAARAFRGQPQPKPLPFDPAKLKGLSEKLLRSHLENNYGGSVAALNAVEKRLNAMLRDKDLPSYVYGDLKREELHRTGSLLIFSSKADVCSSLESYGTSLPCTTNWRPVERSLPTVSAESYSAAKSAARRSEEQH